MEVVLKPRQFKEIDADSDSEEEEEEEEEEVEEEEEEVEVIEVEVYHPPCGKCHRTQRDCERARGGGACVPCKTHKYKCEYATRKRGREEEEEEEEEAPEEVVRLPKKKKSGPVNVVKPRPKVESKTAVKSEPTLKATTSKARAPSRTTKSKKGKGRVVPKSAEFVEESQEVDEEGDPVPRPIPTRTFLDRGKYLFFLLSSF
jgi:hypothetical protein